VPLLLGLLCLQSLLLWMLQKCSSNALLLLVLLVLLLLGIAARSMPLQFYQWHLRQR
jgi:hypothetical protein